MKAIAAGKHVLVEKPLGTSVEECRSLCERAAATRLVVQVGNNRRFDPAIAFAREFITGEMGQRIALKAWYHDSVYRYTMTDNLQPIPLASEQALRPPGNPKADRRRYYLLGHGSHLLDTARFLGGPITGVHARLLERSTAYCWFIAVDFADGSLGHLDLQIPVRGDFQEGFQVQGENGSVTGHVYLPWFHKSSEVECFSTRDRQFRRVLGEDAHTYKRQVEGFAATILNRTPQTGANAERRPGGHSGAGRDRPLGRNGKARPARRGERRCLMQLGIFAKTFPRPTLEQTLDAVAAHGLTHIQFNMSCMGLATLPDRLDEGSCVWIAQIAARARADDGGDLGHVQHVRSQRFAGGEQSQAARRPGRGVPVAGYADHHALHRDARFARHVEVARRQCAEEHLGAADRDDARGRQDRRSPRSDAGVRARDQQRGELGHESTAGCSTRSVLPGSRS